MVVYQCGQPYLTLLKARPFARRLPPDVPQAARFPDHHQTLDGLDFSSFRQAAVGRAAIFLAGSGEKIHDFRRPALRSRAVHRP